MSFEEILAANTTDAFDNIAETLLNDTELVAGGRVFYIAEIEFYLHTEHHPDIYTHCAPEQQSVGKWYFHKTGKSYKGGTFKGLDITFGRAAHGGILIRTLIEGAIIGPDASIHRAGGTVIEGPCKCVDRLLAVSGHATVASMAQQVETLDVWTVNPTLYIRSTEKWYNTRLDMLYRSQRVGLNASKSPLYAALPYRYITDPSIIKKSRKTIIAGLVKYYAMTDDAIRALIRHGPARNE